MLLATTVMHRPSLWRPTLSGLPSITSTAPQRTGRRFASSLTGRATARATGTLVRWGLAGAAVYYYNTSSVFADEPRYGAQTLQNSNDSETYSSIDAISEQRRAQAKQSATTATSSMDAAAAPSPLDSPEGLEQEAQQQGAFNEETGEINWDCPCLGGMADGPCGDQFKAAFSCFVFSKEEPKGVDCIEHFKTMQNCFREHPDIYGSELDDDDGADLDVEAPQPGVQHAVDVAREKVDEKVNQTADAIRADASKATEAVQQVSGKATEAVQQVSGDKSAPTIKNTANRKANIDQKLSTSSVGDSEGELVPKAWHDSTADNDKIVSRTEK